MEIIDLNADDMTMLQQTARLLVEGFSDTGSSGWPDFEAALNEVRESVGPGRISRVAVIGRGVVIGWIGGICAYAGHAWELHPLVVAPEYRQKGIGRTLVLDFEQQVRLRGGETVFLGTDDEDQRTSLGGVDLYPDVLAKLSQIKNVGGHPFAFYQKLGYTVVGVIPDANGPGKPDIFMAKRVS
jgi:aminoglycoside 6'-N-acetyltransferase I